MTKQNEAKKTLKEMNKWKQLEGFCSPAVLMIFFL